MSITPSTVVRYLVAGGLDIGTFYFDSIEHDQGSGRSVTLCLAELLNEDPFPILSGVALSLLQGRERKYVMVPLRPSTIHQCTIVSTVDACTDNSAMMRWTRGFLLPAPGGQGAEYLGISDSNARDMDARTGTGSAC